MISKICLYCNSEFNIKPYRKDTAKCCSRKCLWHITKSQREPKRLAKITGEKAHNNSGMTKICKLCEKEFHISPSRKIIKHYCGMKCYGKAQEAKIKSKRYKRITVDGVRYLEHRYIMEQYLGRKLKPEEHVHHKDRNTHNNDISNLEVLDRATHGRISSTQRGN